jgi:hypothetical protein
VNDLQSHAGDYSLPTLAIERQSSKSIHRWFSFAMIDSWNLQRKRWSGYQVLQHHPPIVTTSPAPSFISSSAICSISTTAPSQTCRYHLASITTFIPMLTPLWHVHSTPVHTPPFSASSCCNIAITIAYHRYHHMAAHTNFIHSIAANRTIHHVYLLVTAIISFTATSQYITPCQPTMPHPHVYHRYLLSSLTAYPIKQHSYTYQLLLSQNRMFIY